jgi:hypothetical protein
MTKIIVHHIETITPGARHMWLQTNLGRMKKPLGTLDPEKYDCSQMSGKIVLLERRLQNWGRWLLKSLNNGLGYPGQSTLVTALQGSRATAKPPQPDNPEAEEIDAIVKKMAEQNKGWAEVLNQHYTRADNVKVSAVAIAMELPEQTYYHYLKKGRKYVENCLKNS